MSAPRGISRRSFLAGGGAAVGAGVLLGSGALSACTSSDGSAAAGADAWPEPAVRASSGGTLATHLRVAETLVPIGTQEVRAVTYEGSYPGPTLEIRPGDALAIDLENRTDQITNLHTHGLHVSPQSPSDNVLLPVAPGETYPYRYAIAADQPAGTYWYHAHHHTLTDVQVFGGLFGMMIVRGELDELPGVAGLPERSMVISQIELRDDAIVSADTSSLSAQATLINGQYQPTLAMAPGETQRWRLLNASSVFLRLQVEGRPFQVLAIDGNSLPAPTPTEVLTLSPGARADVLVQAGAAGDVELRSLSWAQFGMFYTNGMVPVPQAIARVAIAGDPVPTPPLPHHLLPFEDLREVTPVRRRTFRLEEREPRGTGDLPGFQYYVNGDVFRHDVINETMQLGTVEEWEFTNLTYEPHPVHIHVNPFQVVAIDGQPSGELHYRDTALLPPFGSITVRQRFEDFTGVFPWHCHILFHEDHGMMQLLQVVDGPAPEGPQPFPGATGDERAPGVDAPSGGTAGGGTGTAGGGTGTTGHHG